MSLDKGKLIRKIAQRDKEVFDVLIEFERTGKVRTKQRLNFTVDKAVAARFRRLCRKKGYNMSAKIEQAIRGMVD